MKILIKSNTYTHNIKARGIAGHIGAYWGYFHYDCWKELGHEVAFYDQVVSEPIITNKHEGYDVLFCRGYLTLRHQTEFLIRTLKEFRGKKILYLEGADENNLGEYFDTIFIPELPMQFKEWENKYPHKDIRIIPWTSARFDLIDKNNTNPYPSDDKYRIIYTGIVEKRYLENMIKLANMGENIVFGGMYHGEQGFRELTEEEEKNLPSNIQLVTKGSLFQFGDHFRFLKCADLAIGFISYPIGSADRGSLSSKLIEYLNCGLPIVCEDRVPNRFRVNEYDAGTIVKWNNFDSLYEGIQKEKQLRRNKQTIMDKARTTHNPLKICEEILK